MRLNVDGANIAYLEELARRLGITPDEMFARAIGFIKFLDEVKLQEGMIPAVVDEKTGRYYRIQWYLVGPDGEKELAGDILSPPRKDEDSNNGPAPDSNVGVAGKYLDEILKELDDEDRSPKK